MSTTKSKPKSTSTDAQQATRTNDPETFESTPSTKPTLLKLGATLLVGLLFVGVITTNPGLFGSEQIANVAANLVLLLTVIGAIRLLARLYILTRTRYYITSDGVRREYSLLYRSWSRELPLSMIRGHELTRSRLETLFGVGTVQFLSGSVAGSIGHLRFDQLANPEEARETVQRHIRENEASGSDSQ